VAHALDLTSSTSISTSSVRAVAAGPLRHAAAAAAATVCGASVSLRDVPPACYRSCPTLRRGTGSFAYRHSRRTALSGLKSIARVMSLNRRRCISWWTMARPERPVEHRRSLNACRSADVSTSR
jgi:hypothetical protein